MVSFIVLFPPPTFLFHRSAASIVLPPSPPMTLRLARLVNSRVDATYLPGLREMEIWPEMESTYAPRCGIVNNAKVSAHGSNCHRNTGGD